MEQVIMSKYLELIRRYTEGEMAASEFSLYYSQEFKVEKLPMSEDTYQILQELFREADAHCGDPELREKTIDGIGEAELMEAALDGSDKLERRLREIE